MTIEEKVREIMLSEKAVGRRETRSIARPHPARAFKIDNLNQATPAQLRQLKEALAFSETMQRLSSEN
jgi:hypothetical protein